jgi:hypothetical protein
MPARGAVGHAERTVGHGSNGMTTGFNAQDRAICGFLCNLKTSEIQLRDRLNGLERSWLTGRLLEKRGVCDVEYRDGDRRRLVVAYDADELSGAEVVDLLDDWGLPARTVAVKL